MTSSPSLILSASSLTRSPVTQQHTTLAHIGTATRCSPIVTYLVQSPRTDRYMRIPAGASLDQLLMVIIVLFLLTELLAQENLTRCLVRMRLDRASSKILFEISTRKSRFAGRRIGKFQFIFHTSRFTMRMFAIFSAQPQQKLSRFRTEATKQSLLI